MGLVVVWSDGLLLIARGESRAQRYFVERHLSDGAPVDLVSQCQKRHRKIRVMIPEAEEAMGSRCVATQRVSEITDQPCSVADRAGDFDGEQSFAGLRKGELVVREQRSSYHGSPCVVVRSCYLTHCILTNLKCKTVFCGALTFCLDGRIIRHVYHFDIN